jgi:hypothetical protein
VIKVLDVAGSLAELPDERSDVQVQVVGGDQTSEYLAYAARAAVVLRDDLFQLLGDPLPRAIFELPIALLHDRTPLVILTGNRRSRVLTPNLSKRTELSSIR